MDVFKNDIVAIIEPVYIDYPGGVWADHFVDKKRYYRAKETATNNGNFRAVDSMGKLAWLHTSNVIEVKR